jgi:DNA-binding NarL/FixJ family response regulator
MQVVVCNESEHRCASIARMLRGISGVRVVELPDRSGHTAAELALYQPDLVVMDIVRSGRPRLEVVQRMREAWPNAAVVVFTAHVYPGIRACCSGAGVLCCLHESYGVSSLLQIVSDRAGRTVTADAPPGQAEMCGMEARKRLRRDTLPPAESRNTPHRGFGYRVTMAAMQERW